MNDRIRVGIAWVFALALCIVLISSAYWNLHWVIFPISK
jgi:hypothetical protein